MTQIKPDLDAVFVSFSGPSANGFVRQYAEYGLKGKIPLLASQTTVDESLLKEQGDNAVGIVPGAWYSAAIDSAENKRFVTGYRAETGAEPGLYAFGSYTAGLMLESALKTLKGNTADKDALIKAPRTVKLETSLRGPMTMDAQGNPMTTSFVRKTERIDGRRQNTVVKAYPNVSQYWTYGEKAYMANPVYSRNFPPAKNLE